MSYLTPNQLASMQAAVIASLPNTCSIMRQVTTDNGAGGQTVSWVAAHTNVAVAFEPFRVPFLEQAEIDRTRVDAKSRWEFTFPYNTDVNVKDRVQVDGGLLYEVASPRTPMSYPLTVCFLCELVELSGNGL